MMSSSTFRSKKESLKSVHLIKSYHTNKIMLNVESRKSSVLMSLKNKYTYEIVSIKYIFAEQGHLLLNSGTLF